MRRWTLYLFFLSILLFPLSAQDSQRPDISLSVRINPSAVAPGENGTIETTYTIPEGTYLAKQEQFFFFEVDAPQWVELSAIDYPPGKEKDGLIIYRDSVTIKRDFSIQDNAPPGEQVLTVTAGYQFCDESGVCFIPQQKKRTATIAVSDSTAGTAGTGLALGTILQYLLMALIGGILLNIMPCVLPLLSVKALNLVNQSNQERRKILINSFIYTGGILVSFLIIASIVVTLKLSGELIGWGFQFQNPGFVLVLISVIFVFALSLFDVFIINAPGMNMAAKASTQSGYLGSFFTGVFAVLVATPCTAPFLGAALGFAFTQPPALIVLILVFVGIGLAFPFIILGIWPGFIRKLPRPGNWMNIFKEIMGFLLIGTVLYMLNTLYHQIGGENLLRVIIFLGVLSLASWIYGRFGNPGASKRRQWLSLISAVVIIVVSAFIVLDFNTQGGVQQEGVERAALDATEDDMWSEFSPDLVKELRSEDVPVFISFSAQWCTTCKVNEATVLSAKEIKNAFEEYGIVPIKGDYTSRDEVIGGWIERFGKAGVPVNALFVPDKEEAIVFPELLTKRMLLETFESFLRKGGF